MGYKIDNSRLQQAAEHVTKVFNDSKRGEPWELAQSIVEHFTDEKGRRYTTKVIIQALDERTMTEQ